MITYPTHVNPYVGNYTEITIPPVKVEKLKKFVNKIILEKQTEEHHKIDCHNEYTRFYTGFLGEAALEELFHINIIDWSIGKSKKYHVPDIPGYKVGIKTVENGKFPIIFKNNYYPQIINIKIAENKVLICGLATVTVLNTYQSDDLILSSSLLKRGTKTGFYGFHSLQCIYSLDNLAAYKK